MPETTTNILTREAFSELREGRKIRCRKNYALRKGGDVDVYELVAEDGAVSIVLAHKFGASVKPEVLKEMEGILAGYRPAKAVSAAVAVAPVEAAPAATAATSTATTVTAAGETPASPTGGTPVLPALPTA